MSDKLIDVRNHRMERTLVTAATFDEAARQDREYWLSKTPAERLEGIELSRQALYGYDPTTARLQRVLELVKRE